MTPSNREPALLPQDLALDAYFESMLSGPPVGHRPDRRSPVSGDAAETGGDASVMEVVLFEADGLRLAVPVGKLVRVMGMPADVASPPAAGGWRRGSFLHEGRTVTILDTAEIVIPEHYRLCSGAQRRSRQVLVVGDGTWALACDDRVEIVTLPLAQIRWRTEHGSRPWLAGTVIAHGCGLLDVDALLRLAAEA